MKILPIQKNYCTNYTSRVREVSNSESCNKYSYVSSDLAKKNVNFTGVMLPVAHLAKKIPLEERLASLFEVIMPGDVIFSSKTLRDAQKALKDSVDAFDNVLKRFFYIPDDNIKGSVAFFRGTNNDLSLVNPNQFEIAVKSGDNVQNLKFNESAYLVEGDFVDIKDKKILVKNRPDINLSFQRDIFSRAFDMSDFVKLGIKNQNIKSIRALSKDLGKNEKYLTFADVGGQDKVINELKKGILYPIKYPEAFENSIVNHGYIMYGPPGTGKTLIAQALANETDANFIKLNGLEMESKWVGESEENWRKLFDAARENQPSIIFVDEFDAVAKKRGSVDVYGDKVVNQLLTLMSDVEKNGDDIYVIAATNKMDLLDDAITRSGRFGKHIEVKAPETHSDILNIFDIHTKNKPLSPELDKDKIADVLLKEKTTGADIAFIVNSAHENAFERAGIYKKMEDGTFSKNDILSLRINDEDFKKSITDFISTHKGKKYRAIGFEKYNLK